MLNEFKTFYCFIIEGLSLFESLGLLFAYFLPYSLQNQKNQKIRHTIPQVFWIPFQQKKNFENRTTTDRCLTGVASSRHIIVSLPVCMYYVCMYYLDPYTVHLNNL